MTFLFIDSETRDWLEKSIAEMHAIFADEDRLDYFDGDDTARDIANRLGELLEENKESMQVCPNCGEAMNVEGGTPQMDGKAAWQDVTCLMCGCTYTEVYQYTHTEKDG